MSIILEAYQIAQLIFDNLSLGKPKEDIRDYRRKIYGLQNSFTNKFDRSVASIQRQKGMVATDADQEAVDAQAEYLAKITTLYMSRLPVSFMGGSADDIEHFIKPDIFDDEQRSRIRASIKERMSRDIKASPRDAESIFVNSHHFRTCPNTTGILNDIIVNNFSDICHTDRHNGLYYGVKLTGNLPKDGEDKSKLVALISKEAPKLNSHYERANEVKIDPILLFALWERGGANEKDAFALWEGRVAKLAVNGNVHERHTYGPDVLFIPTEADDLRFDAYDAILDTVCEASEANAVPLLKLARKLFIQHFDALTERRPDKAMKFAATLCERLFGGPEGQFEAESIAFKESIVGMVAVNLVERLGTVDSDQGDVDVAEFVIRRSKSEGAINLAVDASIRRFEAKSSLDRASGLLDIAEKIGEKHSRFSHIATLVVGYAKSQAEGSSSSVELCLKLAKLMNRKTPLRYNILRTAKTLAEVLGETDQVAAEKHLADILKLCTAQREHAKIADDITKRIIPGITRIRPLDVGEKATMDGMLAKLAK